MTPTDSTKTTATTIPTNEPCPQFSTSASLRDSATPCLSNSATPTLGYSVSLCHSEIDTAIQRCLPDDYDNLDKLIFKLAREWKAISQDGGCQIGVREFVCQWYDTGGYQLEEPFDVAWLYFAVACEQVLLPKGMSPAELAFNRAKKKELPTAALRYEDERIRLLVAACRELQVLAGTEPFYLSCRTAGELISVPFKMANRLLHGLCRDGIIEETKKGGIFACGKVATRWRFIAPMN